MKGILPQKTGDPCGADTSYESVVALGEAEILTDKTAKGKILGSIVEKYTPNFEGAAIPLSKIQGTAVVKINVVSMTGKYPIGPVRDSMAAFRLNGHRNRSVSCVNGPSAAHRAPSLASFRAI